MVFSSLKFICGAALGFILMADSSDAADSRMRTLLAADVAAGDFGLQFKSMEVVGSKIWANVNSEDVIPQLEAQGCVRDHGMKYRYVELTNTFEYRCTNPQGHELEIVTEFIPGPPREGAKIFTISKQDVDDCKDVCSTVNLKPVTVDNIKGKLEMNDNLYWTFQSQMTDKGAFTYHDSKGKCIGYAPF